MKRITFLLLFATVGVTAFAQQENVRERHSVENEIGYCRLYGTNGLSLGVQYSYELATHWDIIAGLKSSVGWTTTEAADTPETMAMIGADRLGVGLRYKTNISKKITFGVSGLFSTQMEWSPNMGAGISYIVGTIKFYGEGKIEAMYRLSESTAMGVYCGAMYGNAENGVMPEVGMRAAFKIR